MDYEDFVLMNKLKRMNLKHDYLSQDYFKPKVSSLGVRTISRQVNQQEPVNPVKIGSQVVKRRVTPYWIEQGWCRTSQGYRGKYKTKYDSWMGLIETDYDSHKFYIFNPPDELRSHSHWACFRKQDAYGKYWVHFSQEPENIDEGIISIQKILAEAFEK